MKERGMIFNAEMVRAILNGRKTQTRRVVKFKPKGASLNINAHGLYPGNYRTGIPDSGYVLRSGGPSGWNDRTYPALCPFGAVGDRIWVRETFALLGNEDDCPIDWFDNLVKGGGPDAARIYRASCEQKPGDYGLWSIPDDADWKPHTDDMKFDGAWTPSIHMPRWASRITLEITDVRVERLNDISDADARAEGCWRGRGFGSPDLAVSPVDEFPTLWASIYGEESWFANPWVWVIEFGKI